MSLKIQIYSVLYSFLFGIYFSYILKLFKKYIYNNNIIIKTVSNLVIVIINSFIYFIGINKINNGYKVFDKDTNGIRKIKYSDFAILLPYTFITLILGFYFIDIIYKK